MFTNRIDSTMDNDTERYMDAVQHNNVTDLGDAPPPGCVLNVAVPHTNNMQAYMRALFYNASFSNCSININNGQ